jgi:hypothetical protein
MTIRLDRKTIVALYCYCRQAERSLHRACDPANQWSRFVLFYDVTKRAALRRLLSSARNRLPPELRTLPASSATPVISTSVWRLVSGHLLARWKRVWLFHDDEIRFIVAGISDLLALLDAPTPPAMDTLIARRRQLLDCETIIEARCPGLAELRGARNITYFDQVPGGARIDVSELVPDAA